MSSVVWLSPGGQQEGGLGVCSELRPAGAKY